MRYCVVPCTLAPPTRHPNARKGQHGSLALLSPLGGDLALTVGNVLLHLVVEVGHCVALERPAEAATLDRPPGSSSGR